MNTAAQRKEALKAATAEFKARQREALKSAAAAMDDAADRFGEQRLELSIAVAEAHANGLTLDEIAYILNVPRPRAERFANENTPDKAPDSRLAWRTPWRRSGW